MGRLSGKVKDPRPLASVVVAGLVAVAAWNPAAKAPAQSPATPPRQVVAPGSAPTSPPGVAPTLPPGVAPTSPPGVAPTLPPGVAPTLPPGVAPIPAPPSPPGVAPNQGAGMMHHQDLFRSAKPETANVDWDPRLKPQVRYAPIGDDAIIQGDIVIGKLDDVRRRKLYSWSEELKQIGDIDDLNLTEAQKDVLQALKDIEWPDDFVEAVKRRERSRALRIVADVVRFETQGQAFKEYPKKAVADLKKNAPSPGVSYSNAQVGLQYRWPKGVIPYTIDSNVPDQQLITQAIEHWHTVTDRIHLRSKTSSDQDYVRFVVGDGCSSRIGRIGGEQWITLTSGCLAPQIIHEIGHAVGLWHEQSRNDRDNYLLIHDENVNPDMLYNFDPAQAEAQEVGTFDFGSIMLYPYWAFTDNGQPTMESRWPGTGWNWGVGAPNIIGLSAGDLAGVNWMYPAAADPPNPRHPAGGPTIHAAPAAPVQPVPVPNVHNQAPLVRPPLAAPPG
jgi:hypothetical protein